MKTLARIGGIVAAALVAGALAGCAPAGGAAGGADDGEPTPGGTLAFAVDQEPGTGGMNPFVGISFASRNYTSLIFETLLGKDADGTLTPRLATAWEQVTPTTLRVTLREDAEFSDGSPLTAEDVAFSFENYRTGTFGSSFLRGLTRIDVIDPVAVEFVFDAPNGAFLSALGDPNTLFVQSKAHVESTSAEDLEREPLGSGPFMLETWEDGVQITLARNPNYWDAPRPYLDKIEMKMVPDENSRLSLALQGSVDAVWLDEGVVADQVVAAGFTLGEVTNASALNFYINPGDGPLSDLNVRQALSLSLDRQALVDIGLGGQGGVSFLTPAGDPDSPRPDADTPNYTRDVDAAKKLLAGSAFPSPQITLTYPSDIGAPYAAAYEQMKEQAAEAGITLNLVGVPWSQMVPILTGAEPPQDLYSIQGLTQPDISGYFRPSLGDGSPMNRWGADEYGTTATMMLTELYLETDPAERARRGAELAEYVAENALVITPASVPINYEAWSSRLKGYESDPYRARTALVHAWLAQ